MSERSEFGRRAAAAEKRRALGERSSASGRQEQTVLVTFAKTKVTRAKRESRGLDLTMSVGRVLLIRRPRQRKGTGSQLSLG